MVINFSEKKTIVGAQDFEETESEKLDEENEEKEQTEEESENDEVIPWKEKKHTSKKKIT